MTAPAPDLLEHRLALVMNGGVSLAVWMGGVAQEIDTLRRASNGFAPPDAGDPGDLSTAAERRLFEKWAEVSAAAGRRFTVDVIAGTSAGGLNGVLLAAAIGKGVPLAGLRELWMDAPALEKGKLLGTRENPTSILDGDYFRDQIAGALERLSEADRGECERGGGGRLGGARRDVQDRDGLLGEEREFAHAGERPPSRVTTPPPRAGAPATAAARRPPDRPPCHRRPPPPTSRSPSRRPPWAASRGR